MEQTQYMKENGIKIISREAYIEAMYMPQNRVNQRRYTNYDGEEIVEYTAYPANDYSNEEIIAYYKAEVERAERNIEHFKNLTIVAEEEDWGYRSVEDCKKAVKRHQSEKYRWTKKIEKYQAQDEADKAYAEWYAKQ
ncbi:MAG: hypothetical protein GTN36_00650 [Candidatus Aenigmarchaeota archaeon]|nr:hypothetical protein [Candidatus Aenigmarchaeota archaeon]